MDNQNMNNNLDNKNTGSNNQNNKKKKPGFRFIFLVTLITTFMVMGMYYMNGSG